MTKPKKANDTG